MSSPIAHLSSLPLNRMSLTAWAMGISTWCFLANCTTLFTVLMPSTSPVIFAIARSADNPDDASEIRHAMMSHHYQRVTEILEEVAPGVATGFWHEMSPHAVDAAGNTQRYFNAWTTEAATRGWFPSGRFRRYQGSLGLKACSSWQEPFPSTCCSGDEFPPGMWRIPAIPGDHHQAGWPVKTNVSRSLGRK